MVNTMTPDILDLFPPLTLERMIFLTKADTTFRYILHAALCVMIWDHMLTFHREVVFVWRARWTVIKALFLFNRYITTIVIAANVAITSGLVHGLTNEFCQAYILISTALELLCISFVSFVVLFRLHAAWGGSRNSFVALFSLWSLSFLGAVVAYLFVVYPAKRTLFHEDKFDICFGLIPNLWVLWLPDAILHIVMLTILVWNAISTPRSGRTRILGLLYREGILYYSTTLVVLVGGMITWQFADAVWIGVPLYPGWAVCQIAMSRLLLSLKSVCAFESNTDLTPRCASRLPRSVSPLVSVESHGDYALESLKASRSRTMTPSTFYGSEPVDMYRSCSRQILRPVYSSASWCSSTAETLTKGERDIRMRQFMRTGAFEKRWWWWLLGVDSAKRDARISVDASTVERWDPGDPGPGVKDSRLGRYDHWL